MIFTREDILKILNALLQLGRKDSEFKDANVPLNSNDEITILQDGINKKVSINNLLSTLGLLKKDDFINVSDRYDEYYIQLSEAITIIANNKRKKGLVITFLDLHGDWKIFQFNGELNNFSNIDYWKDLFNYELFIANSILPDEEDLTLTLPNERGNSFIKLKDKEYDTTNFSGMGTKIIRKNIIEITLDDGTIKRINYLSQDVFNSENTIYIIKYDFTLDGDITIPANCILQFDGGCLNNGTLTFNSTKIVSSKKCFDTDITFVGNIINDEVLISWFINASNTMESNRDSKYDCHDVIINAMKLTSCIRGNGIKQTQGWLNLEKIPLAVLTPILIDGIWGAIGIKKANISFFSTEDGQSLFKFSYNGGWYSVFEDCVFTYKGTIDLNWHERISCIEYDNWQPTVFNYWRDIIAYYWTGYFMVNKCYLQEVTFENITVNSAGGFITYNGEKYYGDKLGSSNIVHMLNVNVNGCGLEYQSNYASKCTVPYIWSFCNYMELTIKNAVSQGVGFEGQTILWLGGGSQAQTCILDGFWVEYVSNKLDSRLKISGQCLLKLYKSNISGFYTIGNHQNITIYNHSISTEFYGGSNFIDRSEIAENTNKVDIFLNTTVQSAHFTISDKFKDWIDKGIIHFMEFLNYPIIDKNYNSPSINVFTTETFDVKRIFAAFLYRNKNRSGIISYLSDYNDIPILVLENKDTSGKNYNTNFNIVNNSRNKCGELAELIYRVTVLVDVTEENKDSIYVKDGWLAGPSTKNLYVPEVGTIAGTSTGWIRRICVRYSSTYNPGLNGTISGCKLEIAYNVIKGQTAFRDYDDICYNADTQDITRKPYPKKEIYIAESANSKFDDILSLIGNCTSPIRTDNNVIQKDSKGAVHTQYPVVGTTAYRPTVLTSVDKGFNYFDTTINKPIYWNGTAWIDSTGAIV